MNITNRTHAHTHTQQNNNITESKQEERTKRFVLTPDSGRPGQPGLHSRNDDNEYMYVYIYIYIYIYPTGSFPETLSQRILVGRILVGRLGVRVVLEA